MPAVILFCTQQLWPVSDGLSADTASDIPYRQQPLCYSVPQCAECKVLIRTIQLVVTFGLTLYAGYPSVVQGT